MSSLTCTQTPRLLLRVWPCALALGAAGHACAGVCCCRCVLLAAPALKEVVVCASMAHLCACTHREREEREERQAKMDDNIKIWIVWLQASTQPALREIWCDTRTLNHLSSHQQQHNDAEGTDADTRTRAASCRTEIQPHPAAAPHRCWQQEGAAAGVCPGACAMCYFQLCSV